MSEIFAATESFLEQFNTTDVSIVKDSIGNLWLRATQACEELEFTGNSDRVVKTYCKPHQYQQFRVGNGRPAWYVSEAGFYRMALKSKSAKAEAFIDWLTEDVLPKLRSQGLYSMRQAHESLAEYEARTKALIEENQRLSAANKTLGEGQVYRDLIRQFAAEHIKYSKNMGDFILSQDVIAYLQKTFWQHIPKEYRHIPPPNGQLILLELDAYFKSLPGDKHPFISRSNGCGDIERAVLLKVESLSSMSLGDRLAVCHSTGFGQ